MATADSLPSRHDAAPDPDGRARPPAACAAPATDDGAPVTDIRASHAEREQAVETVNRALGEGRLDLDEAEARMTAAHAARYRSDLPPLLADLPEGMAADGIPAWRTIGSDVVRRTRTAIWGDAAGAPPTVGQQRKAALIALAAVVWFLLCAVVAAGLVAA